MRAALALALVGLLVAGCFGRRGDVYDGEDSRSRAALARLIVDNRTDRTLAISFRYAVGAGGSVTVGSVAPGSLREMAPVPAFEPIVLRATGGGFDLELPPRTFEIDEEWSWVIRSDSTSHER